MKINKRNEKKATKNSSTSLQWHSIVLNFPIFVVSLGNFDAFSASSLIKVFAYGFHLSCPCGCLDDKNFTQWQYARQPASEHNFIVCSVNGSVKWGSFTK